VPIDPRPDGKIGPPTGVIVGAEPCDRALRRRRPTRWRVAYEGVDAEHDRLIYRVIEAL
jgi:hypothetical protein